MHLGVGVAVGGGEQLCGVAQGQSLGDQALREFEVQSGLVPPTPVAEATKDLGPATKDKETQTQT